MNTLKTSAFGLALAGWLLGSGLCAADSGIPNLVGTWAVEAEGGVLARGPDIRENTHHRGEFSTLKAEAVVNKQQGRVLHGVFTSPRGSEKFIAVIGLDNKTVAFADEDGLLDGEIVNDDRLNVIYRHVTATDTVVGVGAWIRKK
ncbi:hypothetical protein CCR95_19785 [Thiocystis minor]|uniref:hypothetical protein n=1 Tax=Thiocystis minor TaxID=61597 RepID=UPI001913C915|nr:hypothetical protein [Thiocystis minor]MBK5966265.1 hypothetical protein [Thiocystis minor]